MARQFPVGHFPLSLKVLVLRDPYLYRHYEPMINSTFFTQIIQPWHQLHTLVVDLTLEEESIVCLHVVRAAAFPALQKLTFPILGSNLDYYP